MAKTIQRGVRRFFELANRTATASNNLIADGAVNCDVVGAVYDPTYNSLWSDTGP